MVKPFALCAALGLLVPAAANAAEGNNWVGLQLGASVPVGDFNDIAQPGVEGGFRLMRMASTRVGVGLDVGYHAWRGSRDLNEWGGLVAGSGSRVNLSAIQTTASVYAELSHGKGPRPYATGGFGLYSLRGTIRSPSFSSVGSFNQYFGYNAGAGVTFQFSHMATTSLGLTYHGINTPPESLSLLTVAISVMRGSDSN